MAQTELPIMKGCHENWTWERYDFPQVAYGLKINWIKVNEKGGWYLYPNLIILMRSTMILGMRGKKCLLWT